MSETIETPNVENAEKDLLETNDLYEKAKRFAQKAHAGQTDKSGKDYFKAHILPVSEMVPDEPWLAEIALLHDVLEDTDVTEADLREKFPDEIVNAVVVMTHQDGEPYEDYIERIKGNRLALRVKICDLIQNMNLNRLLNVTDDDIARVEKYSRAIATLGKELI